MKQIIFTKEQMEAAKDLAVQMRQEADPKLTHRQNMIRSLSMRSADIDAQQVVGDLLKGIETYAQQQEETRSQSPTQILTGGLDRILEGREEGEQRQILMQLLCAGAEAAGQEIPEDQDYSIEFLTEAVISFYSEYSMAYALEASGINPFAEMEEPVAQKLLEQLEDAELTDYVALTMYLGKITGNLYQLPEDMTAAQIGAVTAASSETQKAYLARKLGRIDNQQLKQILKVIGCTLIAVLMTVLILWAAEAGCSYITTLWNDMYDDIGLIALIPYVYCVSGVVALAAVALIYLVGGFVGATNLAEQWKDVWHKLCVRVKAACEPSVEYMPIPACVDTEDDKIDAVYEIYSEGYERF